MSDKICITIPTDEGLFVKIGHFGDAKYYFHYTIGKRDKYILEKIIINPYKEDEEEEHHHEDPKKRRHIFELNKDCNILTATFFGAGGEEFMKKHGLRVVKVKPKTTILEALETVCKETGLC